MRNDEEKSAAITRFKLANAEAAANESDARPIRTPAPQQLCLPGFRDRPSLTPMVPNAVARWVLRILARTEALDHGAGKWGRLPAIAALLGLDEDNHQDDAGALRRRVVRRLEAAEAAPCDAPGPLQTNIAMLARTLGLSALESELLELRCQYWTQPVIFELFEHLLESSWADARVVRVLAVALDVSEPDAWRLLDREQPLFRSGIINLSTSLNGGFTSKLEIRQGLSNALHRPVRDLEELLSFAVRPAPAATLDAADFPHLASEVTTLNNFLRAACRDRMVGVNVLLHGPPGVGKTELSRAVPQVAGLRVFQIAAEPRDGEHLDPLERLRQYRLTQALLGTMSDAVVVLDDIDNVFRSESFFEERPKRLKAWLNELLETNPLPTFWIANDIRRIDPAYVRRFDLVLEVKVPPRSVRRKVLERSLETLPVGADWIYRQAEDSEVSPAVTARLARVLRTMDDPDPAQLQATYEMLARGQKRAAGGKVGVGRYPTVADYRPEWLNVDADIPRLIESLKRRRRGRLLFHGPPGTGKTALAHHIARSIDRLLRTKRASDLVSAWLGETEKNLCAMFDEAAADDVVLLLDEADSFLQDRRLAVRSWEVSEVNELLTQMEGFHGLFICATNFLERLDAAALRRFGLKLSFKPLRPEQAASLFVATYLKVTGVHLNASKVDELRPELARLNGLTPGDFAAAVARWELLDHTPGVADFLAALREECALKPCGAQAIGF